MSLFCVGWTTKGEDEYVLRIRRPNTMADVWGCADWVDIDIAESYSHKDFEFTESEAKVLSALMGAYMFPSEEAWDRL